MVKWKSSPDLPGPKRSDKMTNLIAGLLSLILALTGLCGNLAGSGVEKAVSVDAAVSVEGEFTPLLSILTDDEGKLAKVADSLPGIIDLVNALSFHYVGAPTFGRLAVDVKGEPASSITVGANAAGDGWNVTSTLFPSSVLSVSQAELDQLSGAAAQDVSAQAASAAGGITLDADALKDLDVEAVTKAVNDALSELSNTFLATAGEPETGSFTVAGVEYTSRTPYSITTKEAAAALLTAAKKVITDPSVAPLLAKVTQADPAAKLDEAFETVTAADDADVAPLEAARFTNEAGDTCTRFLITQEDQSVEILSAASGQVKTYSLSGLGMNVALTVDAENRKYSLALGLSLMGSTVSLNGSLTLVSDDESHLEASLVIPKSQLAKNMMILTLSLDLAKVKGRYDVSGTVSYNMIPVKINGSLTTTENRSDLECSLSLPLSPTNPPTVRIKVSSVQGVDVPVQETEGLKEISYASLSQEETGSAFAEEIGESLNTLLDALKKQFPVIETLMQNNASDVVVVETPETVPAE